MCGRIAAGLKRSRLTLFPPIPSEDRAHFIRSTTYSNLARVRVMAWVVALTMPFVVAMEVKAIADAGSSPRFFSEYASVGFLRLLFMVAAIVFLVIASRPASPAEITRRHRIYEVGFILFSLILTGLMTGIGQPLRTNILTELDQPSVPSVGAYLIAAFAFAAFVRMSTRTAVLAFGLSWTVVVITLLHVQPNWAYAALDIINVTFMTVLATALSQVAYATSAREFIHLQLIESQRRQLAQVNSQLADSNHKLRRLSFLDPMTGVPNRRYFNKHSQREWARASREGLPLALVMLDIDHFKEFNDQYGHLAGDRCLAQVAHRARRVLRRPSDLLARYGGDEFVAVLPNTDLDGANHIAEQIGLAISELRISVSHSPHRHLTVSLGTACRYPKPTDKLDALIAAADEALYRAKVAGRNCFVCAS